MGAPEDAASPWAKSVVFADLEGDPGAEASQDRRAGLTMRRVTDIAFHRLKGAAKAGYENVFLPRYYPRRERPPGHKRNYPHNRLSRLVQEERDAMAAMRRDAEAPVRQDQLEAYLVTSPAQKQIKELYFELGMARMLTLGDWLVNRIETASEGLGVIPFPEIETEMLHFYLEHGLLETTAPVRSGKLIHLHLGAGNGALMEHLRRSRKEPFENGRPLLDYWGEIGVADYIYFPLQDLIATFVREEHRESPVVREFINVVSTLILRRIHYAEQFGGEQKSEETTMWLTLRTNVNLLRDILPKLHRYITFLPHIETKKFRNKDGEDVVGIKGDGEFLEDNDLPISEECQRMIQEVFRKRETSKPDGHSLKEESPLSRYLKPEFFDPNTNLAEHITIHPHHVILARFQDMENVFPNEPMFDLVHGRRAPSHLDDRDYKQLMREVLKRLQPGGVLIDDGQKESYTRHQRIDEWRELQEEFGNEFKIEIIVGEGGSPKSVLVQRGIEKGDGHYTFFSEEQRNQLLLEGNHTVSIRDFIDDCPEAYFRAQTTAWLKEVFVDSRLSPSDDGQTRWGKIGRGRASFKGLHDLIDRVLKENVFTNLMWKEIKQEGPKDDLFSGVLALMKVEMMSHIAEVRRRFELVMKGAEPLRRNPNLSVITFPSYKPGEEEIALDRSIPITLLPRNLDIPELRELEAERQQLIKVLVELKEKLGRPPIRLSEFDACFTNPLMKATLRTIFGERNFSELVEVVNVRLREGQYPEPLEAGIDLLGGSLNETYENPGARYVQGAVLPLAERIARGQPNRMLAFCFGHEAAMEAYGILHGYSGFETKRGALEFGAFPVLFGGEHVSTKHLDNKTCSVPMTRSGYTLMPGYKSRSDIVVLGQECTEFKRPGRGIPDENIPPVALSIMKGRAITAQFHPDVRLSQATDRKQLRAYLQRQEAALRRTFWMHPFNPATIANRNFDLSAEDVNRTITPWIARDIGPAFFIPSLHHLASSLLRQLA